MSSDRVAALGGSPFILLIGRDPAGHWLVQGGHGLPSGIFISEAAARGFARTERCGRGDVRIERTDRPLSSPLAA